MKIPGEHSLERLEKMQAAEWRIQPTRGDAIIFIEGRRVMHTVVPWWQNHMQPLQPDNK